MDKETEVKMLKVTDMAKTIAKELGENLYTESNNGSEYHGKEYKYDKLRITYYDETFDTRMLCISFGDTQLLQYDFKDINNVHFLDGKWTDLIGVIYRTIPERQNRRNRRK